MLPAMRSLDSQFGLGFLLSLGALPIAGCPADEEDDTNASNSASVTNNTANTVSATGDTGAGDPTSATDASVSDGTTGTDPSGTDTGGTSITTDTDPTGLDSGSGGLPDACMDIPIPPGCTAYKNKLIECYPRYAKYYETYDIYCACNVSYFYPMYGEGCGQAQEDYYACLGALSCEMLMSKEPLCVAEVAAIDTACFGGGTTGGTTGGGGGE
jgi:hypothetical protein